MKKLLALLIPFVLFLSVAYATQFLRDVRVIDQMAVGTSSDPDTSVVFDVQNTSKGSRPCPAMTAGERNGISSPATGLCVFNTDTLEPNFWTGAAWVSAAFTPNPDGVSNVEFLGDGMSLQRPSLTVRVDGALVYIDVEADGGGDIDYQIGGQNYTLDCTTGGGAGGKATQSLTSGTATVPRTNYIFAKESGGVMTLNTSTVYPTGEFAWVGVANVLTATETSTDGLLSLQRYSDSFNFTSGRGALSYERERIRASHAHWQSGVALTPTITTNGGSPDNVQFLTAAGTVFQLHLQNWVSTDSSVDKVWIANDNTTPYRSTSDLNTELTDANGVTMSGKYFNLVVWGAMSSSGQQKVYVNLPTASYNTRNDLQLDVNSTAVTSIPTAFEQVGFLIAKVNLRHQAAGGGTWTVIDTVDLRGATPGSLVSGVSGNQTEFSDGLFTLFNGVDATKELMWDLSSITTGNTRTLTAPDRDLDLQDPIFDTVEGTVITATTSLDTDTINEDTPNAGVTIDGVLVKDGGITLASGVTADAILDEDDFASNDASAVPTQQSTRAFVASQTEKSAQNRIINGFMRLSQRGDFTSLAAGVQGTYYLDRWRSSATGISFSKQQKSIVAQGYSTNSLYYDAQSNGTGVLGFIQYVEDYTIFNGQPYLLCAWVKSNNSNAGIAVYNGGSYEASRTTHTGGGGWERLCIDATFSASSTAFLVELRINGASGASVSLTVGDYIEATDVILLLGEYDTDVLIPPRPINQEYVLAKRYYQKSYATGTAPGAVTSTGSIWYAQIGVTNLVTHQSYPIPMRSDSTPTVTLYSPGTGASGNIRNSSAGSDLATTASLQNDFGFRVFTTGATANVQYLYHWTADAEY